MNPGRVIGWGGMMIISAFLFGAIYGNAQTQDAPPERRAPLRVASPDWPSMWMELGAPGLPPLMSLEIAGQTPRRVTFNKDAPENMTVCFEPLDGSNPPIPQCMTLANLRHRIDGRDQGPPVK